MIHLQTNLSAQFNALLEILLLLIPSAALGYGMAKLLRHLNTKNLKQRIKTSQKELEECQSNHLKRTSLVTLPGPKATVIPEPLVVERPVPVGNDNLTVIEGIGPKIEILLNRQGISTYAGLAETSPILLMSILKNAGPRFQIHDASTWPEQAKYLCDGNLEKFNEIRQRLLMGKQH